MSVLTKFAYPIAARQTEPQPSTAVAVVPTNPFDELVMEIKSAHADAEGNFLTAAQHAIVCGERLIRLQELVEAKGVKGKWTAIVERVCGIPIRTAQRYIAKAREMQEISEAFGDTTNLTRAVAGEMFDTAERSKRRKRKPKAD